MMEWIKFDEQQPKKGEFIAAIRLKLPSFYWIGKYSPNNYNTDEFEYWLPMPELPKEKE